MYGLLDKCEQTYKLGFKVLAAYSIADIIATGAPIGLSALRAWNAARNIATLGETSQQINVINAVMNDGILLGSRGGYLGSKRLCNEAMRSLSSQHQVEFTQVYFSGTGKNGGEGYYMLYSGNINSVSIPKDAGSFLTNHTHPGGNSSPSIWDIQYLKDMQIKGSPQNSSVILPHGNPSSRFNTSSKTL